MNEFALFFGRFHPVLVHLPIGFLILAGVLEVLSRTRRFGDLRPALGPVLVTAAAVAILSVAAGWLLGTSGGYAGTAYARHKWTGIGVAATATLTAATWFAREVLSGPVLRRAYVALFAATLVLLVAAGHLGATLAHGEGYLTQYTPEPIRATLARLAWSTKAAASVQANQVVVYSALVQPLLQSRCVSCHGPERAESGLRLDTFEGIRKGGQSGPAIAAGRAAASEMIRRIWLPSTDRKAMPSKGRRPLTVAEATLLRWWVDQGASRDGRLADMQIPPDVLPAIEAALGPIDLGGPAILSVKVDPPDPAAVAAVERLGVSVVPLAEGTNFLRVHCTNAKMTFGDAQIAAFQPLASQITWLDLGGTAITDAGVDLVGRFPHLTRLHLDGTRITDAGLAALAGLDRLEYLNLYRTAVTDSGLGHLSSLKNLRTIYLWQTAVTRSGVDRLKLALPRLEADLGLAATTAGDETASRPAVGAGRSAPQ